ncbi:MAG: CDP-alcohol phosphatidyltransferase family protein [Cyclobacteriaceae bacterium]
MKKHIPNFLTCCNLMVGAVGIVFIALRDDFQLTFMFVLIASIFDFADGLAARSLKVQSEIGKQLDSLADLVSFGVLPSFAFCYAFLRLGNLSFFEVFEFENTALFPLLIVPFSALRLARFNISTDQSNEFKGLPTPANAILISGMLLLNSTILSSEYVLLITVSSCFLLVSNIRMIAFKFKSMSWAGNELRYLLLVILIIGFAVFQLSFVPFVIPTYIVFSIVGNYLLQPVVFR